MYVDAESHVRQSGSPARPTAERSEHTTSLARAPFAGSRRRPPSSYRHDLDGSHSNNGKTKQKLRKREAGIGGGGAEHGKRMTAGEIRYTRICAVACLDSRVDATSTLLFFIYIFLCFIFIFLGVA